jgi:transcriptional regulator with XRE-family HTH domain
MTGAELKTIRESLLLSAQGLADRLRVAGLLTVGNVRTVQRWEDGDRPVPDDIAAAVRALDAHVETLCQRGLAVVRAASRQPGPVVLLRYESAEDFGRYHPTEPHTPLDHRLHTAALVRLRRDAEALGRVVRIVGMDPEDYEAWRFQEGLEDDLGTRAAWSARALTRPLSRPASFDPAMLLRILQPVSAAARAAQVDSKKQGRVGAALATASKQLELLGGGDPRSAWKTAAALLKHEADGITRGTQPERHKALLSAAGVLERQATQ